MKLNKKIMNILFILLLTGLQVIDVQPAEAKDQASTVNSFCISLKPDSKDILLNGEPRTIENAPFIQDGIVYVPLRETVELVNGMVTYFSKDKRIMIALKNDANHVYITEIWVGDTRIRRDIDYEPPVDNERKNKVPIAKDGVVFVPVEYLKYIGFGTNINPGERIILTTITNDFKIDDFVLGQDFNLLSDDAKNRFKPTGKIDYEDNNYKEEVYSDGDIEISLGIYKKPPYDGWQETRKIRKIVLLNDKYQTLRGLKVGDSVEKYMDLYDGDSLMNHFCVETSDGRISKIIIKGNSIRIIM
ncbi:hypothetical protein CDQ84_18595 [Clostridium thermosuccinogenes]|uniref:Copper amine oxidase-like N-terminal domain-containing protein n=1 Tax=Clostridium thermosuccinogenes TaxID=84032 RepID=A0A2K2EZ05_9CLOT|nr:stalk domain-containing protein [Pseudoclostridium thermosuccinogenes]PNT91765.1 hypothetical protein CDQ85_18920 [Pseudoclostridium thermosuccinogenes]PNT94639.1 hypothetical protein CDQ84_18595 [Pseudoclostridium thermosuccinogenes]